MEYLLFLIVAIVGIILLVKVAQKRWTMVLSGGGPAAEEIRAKYAYLKSKDVRCRIKEIDNRANQVGMVNQALPSTRVNGLIHLMVHHKDVEKAEQLLREYEA